MIQGIQNVSFNGGKAQIAKTAAKKAETKAVQFVNAAIDLSGTKNAEEAKTLLANAEIFHDTPNMGERVVSYLNSRKPIENLQVSNEIPIIPENSINYIC